MRTLLTAQLTLFIAGWMMFTATTAAQQTCEKPVITKFELQDINLLEDFYAECTFAFSADHADQYRLDISCVNDMSLRFFYVGADQTSYTIGMVDTYSINYVDLVAFNACGGVSVMKTIELDLTYIPQSVDQPLLEQLQIYHRGSELTIDNPHDTSYTFCVHSSLGEMILEGQVSVGSNEYRLDAPSGIAIVTIKENGKVIGSRKIII